MILLLIVLAFAIWAVEGTIDRLTKPICPEGWWHTSPFWAHCAYPPVSISKCGAMYAGYAILALLVIQIAAPAFKLLASRLLLFALMALPAFPLLFLKFSWVETSKLFLVAVVALVFGLGARVAHDWSLGADASHRSTRR